MSCPYFIGYLFIILLPSACTSSHSKLSPPVTLREKVGYQEALVQQLRKDGIYAEAVSVMGQDKRARLALTTAKIQDGDILFPEKGAEILTQQLLGFGVEKNDDLVDAFSLLVLEVIKQDPGMPSITWF